MRTMQGIGGHQNEKNYVFFFLTIIPLVGMTGCGNKVTNDPITLTMWHVHGSQTESPLNVMIDEFNQTKGKRKRYCYFCCLRHKFYRY